MNFPKARTTCVGPPIAEFGGAPGRPPEKRGAVLLAEVVAQLLLVDCRPGQGQQACFFSEIDAAFSSLLGFFLGVQGAARCIELDVGGDNYLGAIYKEEWSKSS